MDDHWVSDVLDEALASVSALVNGTPTPPNSPKLVIEISEDEDGYYDWQRVWEAQTLHNGLHDEESQLPADMVDIGQPWQSLDSSKLPSECESEYGNRCPGLRSDGARNCEFLELSQCARRFRTPVTCVRSRTKHGGYSAILRQEKTWLISSMSNLREGERTDKLEERVGKNIYQELTLTQMRRRSGTE